MVRDPRDPVKRGNCNCDGFGRGAKGRSGFMVMLPPNSAEQTISFTVTEEMVGTWEIGCFELNGVHYDSGMLGTLVINN